MKDLKKLLGHYPRVHQFNKLWAGCSAEEKKSQYRKVYGLAMEKWEERPKKYQTFFQDIVQHDWQGFLDYIRKETVLGKMLYELADPEMFKKVCNLIEQKSKDHKVSYNHFAFALLLGFDFDLKVSVLGDQIRTAAFYPEELKELPQYARILN